MITANKLLGSFVTVALIGIAPDAMAGKPQVEEGTNYSASANNSSSAGKARTNPALESSVQAWRNAAIVLRESCDQPALNRMLDEKKAEAASLEKLSGAEQDTAKKAQYWDGAVDARKEEARLEILKSKGAPTSCAQYCTVVTSTPATVIDFCAFSDPLLAATAVVVAPNDLSTLGDDIIEATREHPVSDGIRQAITTEERAGVAGPAVLEESVTTLLQRGLSALARVIVDRAKREAVGWLLDDVASELCGETVRAKPILGVDLELAKKAQKEIRTHWLPNLCALASENRLDHYGAGAALLEALQGALENDVRGWPGVVAGIALSEFYYVYPESENLALVDCADATSERCTKVSQLRREGERFVARLLDGRDPALASRDLGTAISSIVVSDDVESPQVELLACAVSLPAEIELLEPDFNAIGLERPLTAAIMAGLVRAPACWELTGQGLDLDFRGTQTLARKAKGPRERLSTILRLGEQVQAFERVQVELDALRKAVASLEGARAKPASEGSDEARARAIFLASLAVVDASLATADAVLAAAARFSDVEKTFPALEDVADLNKQIDKARKELMSLRDLLHTLQGFGTGEYAKAITASSRMMIEKLDLMCKDNQQCDARIDAVARHIGTITAILTAETVDDMAAALDAAANPPGGWRSKAMDENFTVSLSAYPGFFAGGEARWGQYGAVWERGGAYAQAPTLTLPFGLDLAWGMDVSGKYRTRSWAAGLFFPLLDPAAFLLYDVDKSGKLPGPRPVTALAPGLAVRLGIPNTPLAVLLSAIYRPQLRTWEATVNGPGANVLQFGVSIAVDVTLWKIYARGK